MWVLLLLNLRFCFLWVLNSTLQFGLQCLNKWGYSFVDKITWVKKSKVNPSNIYVSHGYYLLHTTELCLIGVKHSSKENKLEYISKISNDVIFGKVGIQSQKPEEIYKIIETMIPGARKVELFAKNHNIRKGWLSLGNRLGPNFENDWSFVFDCTYCEKKINYGEFRYKSKSISELNACSICFQKKVEEKEIKEKDFFVFDNLIEEQVYHDWITCDNCSQYPICGGLNNFKISEIFVHHVRGF
jgi:N6-adenosine-specific RNA methylase IME4